MFKRVSLSLLAVLLTSAIAMTQVNVLTYHNNIQRTGWNSQETVLTPSNVNVNNFSPIGLLQTDDRVRTTPLYVSQLTINNATHNAVFVGDDSANIYAFDANTYTLLWRVSALGANEQPALISYCGEVPDHMGIVGTPVIDLSKGQHGVIYFVAASAFPEPLTIHQRLWALNLTDGTNFHDPVEIQAQYPGSGHNSHNGFQVFDPSHYYVRAALTEVNDRIYFGFASVCDGGGNQDYTGWLMQYRAADLSQQSVLNFAPNDGSDGISLGYGGAIWSSGTGFASDGSYLYVPLANGLWTGQLDANGFPLDNDYGNSFVQVTASSDTSMTVHDYFTMWNAESENGLDLDLASGGSIVLDVPSNNQTVRLAIAAGKDQSAYLCRRDAMGKWVLDQNDNRQIWEQLKAGGMGGGLQSGVWGAPAFFNGTIYWGPESSGPNSGYLQAYTFQADGTLPQLPNSKTATQFNYPSTTPSVSSNGATAGIVWAVENRYNSILHAYDATNLATELYHGVISVNPGAHFATPVIANGKVFVSNLLDKGQLQPPGVQVFGLLH